MKECENGNATFLGLPLDPHIWQTEQVLKNVTIEISRCVDCGKVEVSWRKQPDTEDITNEEP